MCQGCCTAGSLPRVEGRRGGKAGQQLGATQLEGSARAHLKSPLRPSCCQMLMSVALTEPRIRPVCIAGGAFMGPWFCTAKGAETVVGNAPEIKS